MNELDILQLIIGELAAADLALISSMTGLTVAESLKSMISRTVEDLLGDQPT